MPSSSTSSERHLDAGSMSPTGQTADAPEPSKRRRTRGETSRTTKACVPCRVRKCRCHGAPPDPCPQCAAHGADCEWPAADGRSSAARRAQLRAPRKRRREEAEEAEEESVRAKTSPPFAEDTSAPLQALFNDADLQPSDPLFDATQYILALSSQLPIVEANEDSPTTALHREQTQDGGRSVRLTWWRPHGPTAIVPGLKRVTIKVRLDGAAASSPGVALVPSADLSSSDDVFGDDGLPRSDLLTHLIDVFAAHFSCQFPALARDVLLAARERAGTAFLLNCVAAMAARFSTNPAIARPGLEPHEYGHAFHARAETLLASSLAVPTRETVSALTLLAHLGLSNASESHMWMYTGMAARMAIDLGLHCDQAAEDMTPEDRRLDRLTFWPIVLLDFALAFGTGRRTTFDLDDITQLFPLESDVESPVPSPFPHAARQMLALGPIINLLNGPDTPDKPRRLREATAGAVKIYHQLPPDMAWSAVNLQRHQQARQAPIFLQMHLWMHTMISNDYLSRAPEPGTASPQAPDVWRNSVRTIGDILVLSDVVDPLAYAAVPYVNQAFYVAGCCYMRDVERYSCAEGGPVPDGGKHQAELFRGLLASAAHTSIATLRQGLERMTTYWSGISWILGALVHRASGIPRNDIDLVSAQEQLAPYLSQPGVVVDNVRDVVRGTGMSPLFDLAELDLFALPFFTNSANQAWGLAQPD